MSETHHSMQDKVAQLDAESKAYSVKQTGKKLLDYSGMQHKK